MEQFRERRYFGCLTRVDNLRTIAGHARLFGKDGIKGWSFYRYAEQAPGWALHRRWNFGLFCIHHVGEGKATDPQGWHVTWAKVKRERVYRGFGMSFHWADTFRTGRNDAS